MSSLLADKIATQILALMDQLAGMTPGAATAGAKPNIQGAILSADHQGFRSTIQKEIQQLQQQLRELGYTIDDTGNAVPLCGVTTTYGGVC